MPLLPGRRYPGSERNLSGTDGSDSVHVSPECIDGIHISHILQILVIPGLDLLDLVGGTETVEEVDERNLALDCGTDVQPESGP